jgi:hypothetical protein
MASTGGLAFEVALADAEIDCSPAHDCMPKQER